MDPTLDGVPVLGVACHCVVTPMPRATQRDSYAGQNGYTVLDGGSRGGRFRVSGVLFAGDLASLIALEESLKGFFDGNLHEFTDTQGRTFSNCYLTGEGYQPSPEGPRPAGDQGWCLPYTVMGESLF